MTYMSQVDRRQQLIDAAIRVLQRDGVGHVTTRAIAAEAGAPLASIHYTFGSKDEIVRAAFEQVITDLLAELEDGGHSGRGHPGGSERSVPRRGRVARRSPLRDRHGGPHARE